MTDFDKYLDALRLAHQSPGAPPVPGGFAANVMRSLPRAEEAGQSIENFFFRAGCFSTAAAALFALVLYSAEPPDFSQTESFLGTDLQLISTGIDDL